MYAMNQSVAMGRDVQIAGVAFYFNIAPCAHNCSFCLLGNKPVTRLPFERMAQLVERFLDARENSGIKFQIFHWIRYSYNIDIHTLRRWVALWRRQGRIPDLMIGGMPMLSADQMKRWLEPWLLAGVEEMHASFAGSPETHDMLYRRKGDYEYRMRMLRIGAEAGMRLNQRLFITRQTITQTPALLQRLDELPCTKLERHCSPFFYMGGAAMLEHNRIDETIRNEMSGLPTEFAAAARHWRSEREWIASLAKEHDFPEPVMLRIDPDESNIDWLEKASIDEIVERMVSRTRDAYASIPSRFELMRLCGKTSNYSIYAQRNDVERLWLDRWLVHHPTHFDRKLTHLSMTH
jgi:hypothetical protein